MTQAAIGERTSLAQQGVWFTEQAGRLGSAYHLALTVEFGQSPDPARLERAVTKVVERHPALRTAFRDDDGLPVSVPASGHPRLVLGGDLATLVREPFDLAQGPLARFVLTTPATLVVVAHHLIFDGMSKDVLLADLAAAYAADLPPLTELPDGWAAADEARVAEKRAQAQEFWQTRWSEPGEPRLPGFDRSGSAGGGAEVRFPLPPSLHSGAESLGVTRFELVLAAVHVLLWRYGNIDPSVAIDLSTRAAETVGHIGLWVNELPVRTAPLAEQTWRGFAHAVRAELRSLYAFRDVPLSRAVPGLKPRAALCPVSVSYRGRTAEVTFGHLPVRVDWLVFPGVARNALHLQFVDGPEGVEGSVQFQPGLLPATYAQRIARHLVTLLDSVLAAPGAPLGDLPLLTAAERESLRALNDTAVPLPESNVVTLFEERVRENPHAVAIVDGPSELTYTALNAWADRIAGGLHRRGAGPGAVVGLQVERGAGMIAALLGILKAGAAYLPLDPAYPEQRRQYIVDDANASLVLTDLAECDADPVAGLSPGELAYVIYTSGSTGHPKGVEITHRSLLNLLLAMRDLVGAQPADRWLALTSLSFDISGLEIFLPLISGARLVIATEKAVREGKPLSALIQDSGVTHVQATPSSWRMLADAGFAGGDIVGLCGGEPLDLTLAATLRDRLARLFNVYGPTETTIWSTASEIEPRPKRVTIGRPLANTTVHVLDERCQPVPPGVIGELYLGGAGLARGYRGRPGQTAARFLSYQGERVYRTGDLVRLLDNGMLEFHGRIDNQIKLRGYRIELGEIEKSLLAFGAVGRAAVVLREDDAGEARLVAYLTGDRVDLTALRSHLAARLPAYMLPAAYVVLEALPLTPNGKLDRAALPAPAGPAGNTAVPASADADLTAVVTGIWSEVLRISDIQTDDSLFDLGGHSLTITQITARLRKNLGVDVPFDVFFDTPTIEGIVTAIVALRQGES